MTLSLLYFLYNCNLNKILKYSFNLTSLLVESIIKTFKTRPSFSYQTYIQCRLYISLAKPKVNTFKHELLTLRNYNTMIRQKRIGNKAELSLDCSSNNAPQKTGKNDGNPMKIMQL